MSLTPNDIRSYELSTKMRGYDKEEVDNLLEQIAQELEQVKQENVKLSMELDALRVQVSNLKQNEEIIKSAAIDARRNADQTVTAAKKEAQALLARAKEEIERVNALKKKKIEEIEKHVKQIEGNRKSYLAKLRTLISSHLDLVEKDSITELREAAEAAAPPSDLKVTESKDITPDKMETIGRSAEDEFTKEAEPEEDKTDVPMELRTTVHHDSEDEPERVEESEVALADALRKYDKEKETMSSSTKIKTIDDEEKPRSAPSLASPKDKWVETNSRAEDVPPGFIAKGQNEPAPSAGQQPHRKSTSDSQSMEPNPVLMEEMEAQQQPPKPAPPKPNRTGKVDVAKEFDEIAAKFNEEMDKAERK